MTVPSPSGHARILVIDDNPAIHEDFRKIFSMPGGAEDGMDSFETALFGRSEAERPPVPNRFELDFASQGREGLDLVRQAIGRGRPYALAFVDVRMPPGWDGVETATRLWDVDPDLQIVICSAYSDYSWTDMVAKLGSSDRMVILKKPFDPIEAQQLAQALTEKWRLFQAARQRVADLESVVRARTGKLETEIEERKRLEQQVRQAQKMEAFGQLAGGVAHDFNNILTVIVGYTCSLLADPALAPALRDQVEQIHLAGERAANLTRQLLTFSRRKERVVSSLDLNEVIDRLTRMLERVIGENIRLECRLARPLPSIQADAGMMEQVLMNLAVNARDAMPKGGRLQIATELLSVSPPARGGPSEIPAGEFVCLSVRDDGCGMPPEIQARIFEPFFTTKDAGHGTGLGLATVFGIAKQHQGWVQVESEVGRGSTFRLYLPAAPASSAAPPTPDAPRHRSEIRGGSENILLVEDEPRVRHLAKLILERQGYGVLEAESGVAALEVWKTHAAHVDLLVTDLIMPDGLTGRELAKQLLADKPGLKVIYSSGYSPETAGTTFFARESPVFLSKPYSPAQLIQAVRECLDTQPAVQA